MKDKKIYIPVPLQKDRKIKPSDILNRNRYKTARSQGSTLLELAVVIPVLTVITLGLLDISNYYRSKSAIQQASEETLRCLASLEDCATLPTPGGEALYEVRAVSGTTTTSLPLVRLNGTVTGLTPERVSATSFDVQYLSSVYLTGFGRTLLEATYRPLVNITYLVRSADNSTRVGLKADQTYDVTGDQIAMTSAQNTVSPDLRTISIPFRTHPAISSTSDVMNRCVIGSLESGKLCENIERNNLRNYFMLLLEGTAKDGVQGAISVVNLTVRNDLTGQVYDLGSQQFQNPGPGRSAFESFLPRGAKYFTTTTPELMPNGSEYTIYEKTLLLNYDTPHTLNIRLQDTSSARWQLTSAKLVLPKYEEKVFNEFCPTYMSAESIKRLTLPNAKDCQLSAESTEKIKFLVTSGNVQVMATQGEEGEKKDVGIVGCQDSIPKRSDLSVAPAECEDLKKIVSCSDNTMVSGVPNYGVPEKADVDGRITSSVSATEVCGADIPDGFIPQWWNVATMRINELDLAQIEPLSIMRADCLTEPSDSELIPVSLRPFHHITVNGRSVSSKPQDDRDFVKYQEGKDVSPNYDCFKKRTIAIADYLSNDAPFGYAGEYDCSTAERKTAELGARSTPILSFNTSTSLSKNRYKVDPKTEPPACYKAKDLITELVGELSDTVLPIGPLT